MVTRDPNPVREFKIMEHPPLALIGEPITATLRQFKMNPSYYMNYPAFQRRAVAWNRRKQQRLVDTMLRGGIIPPFSCYMAEGRIYTWMGDNGRVPCSPSS